VKWYKDGRHEKRVYHLYVKIEKKGVKRMSRKYTQRTEDEKLMVVKRHLSGESARGLSIEIGSSDFQVRQWTKLYLEGGETALKIKKKPGNPLSKYARRKELSYTEQLEYKIELLKRELLQKEAEVIRLKKQNERKGGDAPRN
jgi:transposase-like protein